jgi:predicted secreted hydrolase
MNNDFPNLCIDGREIIRFDEKHYNKTGEWKYYLDLNIDDTKLNLEFIGSSKGWKIETPSSCWAVPLPKAFVKGNIKINDKLLNVKGIGYHDHNWNYSPITAMNNLGWFWGRITADTLNITWAKTMENFEKYELISIINQDRSNSLNNFEYYNINPNNIIFKQSNFIKNHRHLIPSEYYLEINEYDKNQDLPVEVKINMRTLDVQHTRIFTIHYWRYHVETDGSIRFGKTQEFLDNKPQIIEYLSFKS